MDLKYLGLPLILSLLTACSGIQYFSAATQSVVAHDQRSFKQQMQDKKIEIELQALIHDVAELRRHTNVNVHIINNHVFLTGQAPSTVLQDKVIDVISKHQHTQKFKLRNFIRIKPYTSLSQRTQDNYITGMIMQNDTFAFSTENYHIHVITEDSEVFLLGLVSNNIASQAIEIARKTPGVKKVVHAFEIIEASTD